MNTTNHTGEELKPCPFCGAKAELIAIAHDWWRITIEHSDDCINFEHEPFAPKAPEQRELLVVAWNRRAVISGEDAANGAIGERPIDEEDAFQEWWETRKGQETNAYHGWMARAALTAEKVAAEPVAEVVMEPFDTWPRLKFASIAAMRNVKAGDKLYDAPQPAQTQVALTAAPRYREWLHLTQVGMWTAGVPTWARDHDGRMNDGIAMRSVIEELAALLAAQPVSGGKS